METETPLNKKMLAVMQTEFPKLKRFLTAWHECDIQEYTQALNDLADSSNPYSKEIAKFIKENLKHDVVSNLIQLFFESEK